MAAYLYSLAFDSCRLGPAHGLLFFFTEDFFCYSRARIDTEYFFHESTLLYFFNTLMLRAKRRNLQTRSMSCNQNSRFGCVVYGYEGSVSLLDEMLCTRLSHVTFGFQNSNTRDNQRLFLMHFLERRNNLTPYPRGKISHFDQCPTQL